MPWCQASAQEECLECHGDQSLTTTRGGQEVSLYVAGDLFALSVHGGAGIGCQDCHTDATESPHPENLLEVDCGSCHGEVATAMGRGVHAGVGAKCTDCHGSHDIRPASDPQSRVHPLRVVDTCGSCHADSSVVGDMATAFTSYEAGQHGISSRKGLLGVAVCTDCHGSHEILPKDDPRSPAHRSQVAGTCQSCHPGATEVYSTSIHGHALAEGVAEAPTCSTCHDPHKTLRVDKEAFLLDVTRTCGGCHEHPNATYIASYHGQVADLGFADVAKCVDCHGSHNVLPASDPASTISDQNLLATCQKCHPTATANFTGFAPHLDHGDPVKFPVETAIFKVMGALLINVFLFFGAHTLLWFIRGMMVKIRHEGPPHLGNPTGRWFLRFNFYQRITHFLIFTSFVTLSVTGLPLKFHETEWAKLIAHLLGGFEVCGVLHRMMGVVTFGYFGLHLGYVAYLWISGRMKFLEILWGPKSMVPQPQDAVDIANTFKWFLGLGPKPKYGRFTYWEKFDYLAVFWGVAVIGLSGLVLWFPAFFTRLLPGIVVNISWIIHADEALLATGFIFLIHFFNTHLRVEKFPLDPVILTGRIDEEEMRHERALEFAMRRTDGSLREIQTTPPPLWLRNFARAVGWTFVFIGFALLIAMLSSFFV
ncbi:MAG: cytochrome c3 family protein [Thermodesulfobacteriota bacterium]